MQTETGKRNSPGILIEANTAQVRRPIVPAMDAETVEIFAAPVERKLEDFVEFSDAGVSVEISRRRQTKGLTPQSTTRSW